MTSTTALLGLLVLETLAASCATAEEGSRPDDEIDGGPLGDAAVDAGCDADSEGCAPEVEVSCDDFEWCPAKTNHPQGRRLTSVWGSGPSDVWVVGAAGSAIHWDGTLWSSVPVGTPWSLHAVWGTGPNEVWVVSSPDKIFHTSGFADGKASWSPVTAIAPDENSGQLVLAIWGTSPTDVWVGGNFRIQRPDSELPESGWRSLVVDGGTTWTPMSSFGEDETRSIWGSGPSDIWLVGSRSKRSFSAHTNGVSADGGIPVWKELETYSIAPLYAVWGSGPGDVWAVGDYGTILHFVAGAEAWHIVDSPTKENLRGLWGAGPRDIWAVGERGTLLHYDGEVWRPSSAAFALGRKPSLYGVWGSGPSDVWAVGNGIVLHYSGAKPGLGGKEP